MDASVASWMENKAGIDERKIADGGGGCVKEKKRKGCDGDTVNGVCFFGERQELCKSYGLSAMERPRNDRDRLRFNLADCELCRIGLGVVCGDDESGTVEKPEAETSLE